MRFWDSSALAPLIVEEATSAMTLEWLRQDAGVVIWGLTRLELTSAVERRVREGSIAPNLRREALRRVARLADDAHEVVDLVAVRQRAMAMLARYPLRAADAAQLGAALLVADPNPASLTMVVLDRRLADAADREGIVVLTAP
jgi:uncharacterized protein